MATPKNNRKKGKKRQPMHSKPMTEAAIRAKENLQQEEAQSERRTRNIAFVGLLLMVGGFIIAMSASRKIGYPITFIGSLIGIMTVKPDQKHRMISLIAYTLYCLLVAFMWFMEMQQG